MKIWSDLPVRVQAPATSANLGPGFDALGLALSLHDVVEARVTDGTTTVEVSGEGAETAALGDQHLVVRTMLDCFARMGVAAPGLAVRCVNAIPHGRGLGSSAAAIVSGVLAARALARDGQDRMSDTDVLGFAAELEGHPDNVAACLTGGAVITWAGSATGKQPKVARLAVLPTVSAVVCVAPTVLATAKARRALPGLVTHADAAANSARAALLVAALTEDPTLLFDATEDFLHQRYRADIMPDTARLLSWLRRDGVAAVVSGAGPSILALTGTGQGPGAEDMDSIARETGTAWHVTPLDIDRRGAALQSVVLGTSPPDVGQPGRPWSQASLAGTPSVKDEARRPGAPAAGESPQGRPDIPAT